MNVAIVAGILLLLLFGFRYFLNSKSKRKEGKIIDASLFSDEIGGLLKEEKSILYFFTPVCAACKTQAPIIDKLKEDIEFVGKIDLMDNENAAKEFGILGTPTIAIMKGSTISEIFVGLKKYNFLKTKFETV